MLTRRMALASAAALLATSAIPAFAAEPEVYSKNGKAIGGYDPVAYFTQGGPAEGTAAHSSEYNGATWHFTSAENKALFDEDPAKYAPQYGGYCAYAVSRGYTAKIDPDAWRIVDEKLYLNFNKAVRLIWARDIPGNIQKADENWPEVLNAS